MSDKDGGSAFACAAGNGHQPGMTLRDYFAGQALLGYLASETFMKALVLECGEDVQQFNGAITKDSYLIADAMLKERGRGG